MKKTTVMVAGLPGKMATLIAEAIVVQEDMILHPCSLSEESQAVNIGSSNVAHLIPTERHESVLNQFREEIDLVVDFTQPRSVNRNARLYCAAGIPFVMGTTGGDRQELMNTVEDSTISAVIATNMAAPVVMFQSMIRFAAEKFRHSLDGFKLVIRESHQAEKLDPSGTAISLLESFAALGMPLKPEQIIMERNPVRQELDLHIPVQYLGGHGYHTYTLLSPDGTVMLQFTHNILGRSVYVDGALKAIRFLATHMRIKGEVFSMVDVLRG